MQVTAALLIVTLLTGSVQSVPTLTTNECIRARVFNHCIARSDESSRAESQCSALAVARALRPVERVRPWCRTGGAA